MVAHQVDPFTAALPFSWVAISTLLWQPTHYSFGRSGAISADVLLGNPRAKWPPNSPSSRCRPVSSRRIISDRKAVPPGHHPDFTLYRDLRGAAALNGIVDGRFRSNQRHKPARDRPIASALVPIRSAHWEKSRFAGTEAIMIPFLIPDPVARELTSPADCRLSGSQDL